MPWNVGKLSNAEYSEFLAGAYELRLSRAATPASADVARPSLAAGAGRSSYSTPFVVHGPKDA